MWYCIFNCVTILCNSTVMHSWSEVWGDADKVVVHRRNVDNSKLWSG